MVEFNAVIEGNTKGGFWAFLDEDFYGFGVNAKGATIEEVKQELEDYAEYILTEEIERPKELKDGYKFNYKITVEAFLSAFTPVIGKKGMERITGISNKQIWKYQNGVAPRQKQIDKIDAGLKAFAKELSEYTLIQNY